MVRSLLALFGAMLGAFAGAAKVGLQITQGWKQSTAEGVEQSQFI